MMKVTISFADTKVGGYNKIVVPCDDGEITIHELATRASVRYHRIFSRSERSEILFLKVLNSNAILDFEDVVKDVIDDNEMLVACFSHNELYEDDIIQSEISTTYNEGDHITIIEQQNVKHEQATQSTYNETDSSIGTVSMVDTIDSKGPCKDTNSSVDIADLVDTIISKEQDKRLSNSYKCGVCYKELPDREQFLSHQSTHKTECLLKCPKCPQFFTEQCYLDKHLSDLHSTSTGVNTVPASVACALCGKVLKHLASYRSHMLRHSGERPHKCTYCDKSFQEKNSLKIHTRTHTGERPYWCPISGCGKAFIDSSTLRKHESRHSKRLNKTD